MRERQVALITLKYGAYCSPVSVTFRIQSDPSPSTVSTKTKFLPCECFELVLDAPFGDGSAKFAYPAKLSVTLDSGEVLYHNLVVKFAFSAEKQDKLATEYQIYRYMSQFEMT